MPLQKKMQVCPWTIRTPDERRSWTKLQNQEMQSI